MAEDSSIIERYIGWIMRFPKSFAFFVMSIVKYWHFQQAFQQVEAYLDKNTRKKTNFF